MGIIIAAKSKIIPGSYVPLYTAGSREEESPWYKVTAPPQIKGPRRHQSSNLGLRTAAKKKGAETGEESTFVSGGSSCIAAVCITLARNVRCFLSSHQNPNGYNIYGHIGSHYEHFGYILQNISRTNVKLFGSKHMGEGSSNRKGTNMIKECSKDSYHSVMNEMNEMNGVTPGT